MIFTLCLLFLHFYSLPTFGLFRWWFSSCGVFLLLFFLKCINEINQHVEAMVNKDVTVIAGGEKDDSLPRGASCEHKRRTLFRNQETRI